MQRTRRIVAAALGGGALTTLIVAALALGAGHSADATVTLQVASRGPGSVTAVPTSPADTQPCKENYGQRACTWSYERGTTVRLTAAAAAGKSFFAWSDPDCGTNSTCTVRLDDDLTSVVAVFSPLMLAVRFSENDGGATVSANPPGQLCDALEDEAAFCAAYAPHTRVALTVKPGSTTFGGWNSQIGDYFCEPTNTLTCTISVEDQPTWAAARFAGDGEPQPPTSISVEFKLRKGGNGGGRVTASKLDCGTVCTASYGFGKSIALTAKPDDGSLFDGWNGVCARTQLTCTFPAGPITSIRAAFSRDATPPTTPGSPVIGSRSRSSIAVSWAGSTDNVGVAGYRVYINDAAAGETQATTYTIEGLKCGRTYAVAVDAVDGLGNRSPRATVTTQTSPCALAARMAGVGVGRVGGVRVVVAVVRVNRATSARLRLLRGGRSVLTARFAVVPGTNRLRLRVPRRIPKGPYRLATTLINPDGGTLVLAGRGVLLPRP